MVVFNALFPRGKAWTGSSVSQFLFQLTPAFLGSEKKC